MIICNLLIVVQAMYQLQLFLFPCLLVLRKGKASEGVSKDMELLHSANSVPHLGKRIPVPVHIPSFTSGFLVPSYPKFLRARFAKRDPEKPETINSMSSYRPSWQFGKRDPWTGAWANIVWRPDIVKESEGALLI